MDERARRRREIGEREASKRRVLNCLSELGYDIADLVEPFDFQPIVIEEPDHDE